MWWPAPDSGREGRTALGDGACRPPADPQEPGRTDESGSAQATAARLPRCKKFSACIGVASTYSMIRSGRLLIASAVLCRK